MNPEEYRRVKEIFIEAIDVHESDRESYVQTAAQGNQTLIDEVTSLLDSHLQEHSIMDTSVGEKIIEQVIRSSSYYESLPSQLGDYEIKEQIGRGGMGEVYLAEQQKPKRLVALKIIRPSAVTTNSRKRFELEGQLLAQMNHPGIARIYESGEFDLEAEKLPYISMEYIEGPPLGEYHKKENLSIRQSLELAASICDAVHHAHQKGIIHRDLKPSNILVTKNGNPKVLDFGVARVFDKDIQATTVATEFGHLIGTLQFMSPEQLSPDRAAVDTRTDIYSIGVILYQMLTRQLPYKLEGKTTYQAIRLIMEEPIRSLTHHARGIPAEVDVMVGKALSKDPDQRYESAAELAQDIRRFLAHEPIKARPPSSIYLLKLAVRRNKAVFLTATGGLIVALGILIAYLIELNAARVERNQLYELSEAVDIRELIRRADELWPPTTRLLDEYATWIDEAVSITDNIKRREEDFENLAKRSLNPEADFGKHIFEDKKDTWRYVLLVDLINDHITLKSMQVGLETGPDPNWGLGIQQRLNLARRLERESLTSPSAQLAWETAHNSIKDPDQCPQYAGLDLKPQFGLLPIRQDPKTKLWEFLHLQSGTLPSFKDDISGYEFAPENGIVLVLLPGGTFHMGSQDEDPKAKNYYDNLLLFEIPVHKVELDPFFISKYEMTQSQWQRITSQRRGLLSTTGFKLENYVPDLLHPVSQVNWMECNKVLNWMGLDFPTEAQWEYAARAGSDKVWFHGSEREGLDKLCNLADQSYNNWAPEFDYWQFEDNLNDGFPYYAPVGNLGRNSFGLYDIYGNVWEWCKDWYGFYGVHPDLEQGTGLRKVPPSAYIGKVRRGGSYRNIAKQTRSAYRNIPTRAGGGFNEGLRPARQIHSSWNLQE